VIEVAGLVKRYGATVAVDGLAFTARPGRVTAFLGPNGAGKTTTLRVIVGLARPDAGTATVEGVPYARLPEPVRVVGAVLEAQAGFHPGRTARDHLRVMCDAAGLPLARADEVLERLGIALAGRQRVGTYSLGMRQRLGLAAALLGDPRVLILDEPANGPDPAGIRWLRRMLRALAAEGRTVLVSSHVLSEVAQTVDDVVIIAAGRLVRAATLEELMGGLRRTVRVRSPQAGPLAEALAAGGAAVTPADDGALVVEGRTPAEIGELCGASGWVLHELTAVEERLEDVFLRLTGGAA
jgi:ABC-2 type transport system ATP-binding protein